MLFWCIHFSLYRYFPLLNDRKPLRFFGTLVGLEFISIPGITFSRWRYACHVRVNHALDRFINNQNNSLLLLLSTVAQREFFRSACILQYYNYQVQILTVIRSSDRWFCHKISMITQFNIALCCQANFESERIFNNTFSGKEIKSTKKN